MSVYLFWSKDGNPYGQIIQPNCNCPGERGLRLLSHRPFRRLTARLRGPKLCLSPHPHWVRHELRPPALVGPDNLVGRVDRRKKGR
jgi:hypothetical protein